MERKNRIYRPVLYLRVLPEEEVRACILGHIKKLKPGFTIYPSDISLEYGIDFECVMNEMEKMLAEGIFKSVENKEESST